MIKLLCIDLDGTLLDDNKEVSKANIAAIRAVLDKGIRVMLVSGRPNCFASMIARKIDERVGIVTFNGAYYKLEDKEVIYPIPKDTVMKIAQLAHKLDIRTFFKNRNLSLCNKDDPKVMQYDELKPFTPVEDQMEMIYECDVLEMLNQKNPDILKILTWDETFVELYDEVLKLDGINIFCHEHEGYFELCSNKTSKGLAIRDVANSFNINREEIMGIGDSFNDLSMFENAGVSVAMGNAPEKIQKQCSFVTKSNVEDGVAWAINKLILENN